MSTATQALRAAVRDLHARIETTPFARSLLDRTVHLDAYVGYLRVLAVIHAALESSLDSCDDPPASLAWSEDLRRLPELLDDIDAFRWQLVPDAPRAIQAALRAASHVRLASRENPAALPGCLYVLAGSSRGAVVLAPLAAQALGLSPERGLSYLTRHAGPADWERAASRLDAVADAGQIQAMVESALVVFECLLEAFEALWPLDRADRRFTAAGLNPEGGAHPAPQDERDVLAVLRATERSLAEFPYFLYRYGQRARRFADSDGAWLATLPDLGAEAMQAQTDWLGRTLAARGMPRLLLARHLEVLAEELAAARPDQVERSSLLVQVAGRMRRNLEARLPRSLLKRRVIDLERACGRRRDFACAEAISLLASAAVDEADGLTGAATSLLSWLADPNRFPQPWIDALHAALADWRRELAARPQS